MWTFFITGIIIAAVCCIDCRAIMKAGPKRLKAFYTVGMVLSVLLIALHCIGIRFMDIIS